MAFFGRIEDLSIVDLIQYLHAGGKGGTLKLTRRNDTDFVDEAAYVYFQKGNIVHAVAPQRTCIGDLLIDCKAITLKTLQKALVHQAEQQKDKPVGHILVEMGAITQEQLSRAVIQQIEQAIYYLVTWPEGEFAFDANEMTPVDDINLNPTSILPTSNVNTQYLLLEAVRLQDEKKRDRPEAPKPPAKGPADPLPEEPKSLSADFRGKVPRKPPPDARVQSINPKKAPEIRAEEPVLLAPETRSRVGKSAPILLLTDDGIFKNLLRVELQEKGFEVVTPSTTEECLSKCGQYLGAGVIPFVLVEDQRSGTNRRRGAGKTILADRERTGSLFPVMIMLSEVSPEAMLELYTAGARAVFPKPTRHGSDEDLYPESVKKFGEIIHAAVRQFRENETT